MTQILTIQIKSKLTFDTFLSLTNKIKYVVRRVVRYRPFCACDQGCLQATPLKGLRGQQTHGAAKEANKQVVVCVPQINELTRL
ncbi:hypothetical protein NQ317_017823 [Molorchus minor]|uniref:Uncharacterized protein n=1 Tax=Molorchus minor TaxID=1323400 RepID=A0ABQ9K3T0_9CUCU|nr:hypothetical protein NQ317_017823 [Molorchus minor]